MKLYQDKLLDHYQNPRNYQVLRNASVIEKLANISCGDEICLYLKIDRQQVLKQISFQGQGCAVSLASASILTELAKNKPISELQTLSLESFLEELNCQLSLARIRCASLALETLKSALEKYIDQKSN